MIDSLINNFYFTNAEAKVYLSALQIGRSRVSVIAKKANLNRITCYEILKRLREQGIAASAFYNNILTFKVIEPNKLYEKMERKLRLAEQIVPQLTLLSGANKTKPRIEFYEGEEGIRTIYEHTLENINKKIFDITNPRILIDTLGKDYFNYYVKKRVRKKIMVKVLLPNTLENKKLKKETKMVLRHVKFFDSAKYKLPNEIMIWDNKIALFSFINKLGVIIEDPDITQSIKSMWQMIWDITK